MFISISKTGNVVRFPGGERKTVGHARTSKMEYWRYEYDHAEGVLSQPLSMPSLRRTLNAVGRFMQKNDLGIGEYSIMHSYADQIRVAFPWVVLGPTTIELIARMFDKLVRTSAWKHMMLRLKLDPMGKHQVLYVTLDRSDEISQDTRRTA